MDDTGFDVIVIGGGAAGLSAALTLARARRPVLVLDAGEPRNAPAEGVHGWLGHEGIAPAELIRRGTAEVTGYGGSVVSARATSARRGEHDFAVTTDDGREFTARRLLVTTGLVDELPDLQGLRELWGHDVLHCPFCHGWEVRDQPIGILATGPFATHQALMFRQLSADVTVFGHTAPDPTPDEREQLAARDIAVVEGEVAALEITDGRLTGVRLASGQVVPRRALVVTPRFVARSGVLDGLGLAAVEHPMGVGWHVEATDPTGLTSVPGVRVAGNVTDLTGGILSAAAAGVMAAAGTVAELNAEDTARAVQQRRAAAATVAHGHGPGGAGTDVGTEEFWEGFYGERDRIWSGNANAPLVEIAAELKAGTALDLGCGEGGDAIWLARQGWQVTAVDVSATVLARAAGLAAEAGIADRIEWRRHDLARTFPDGSYDLVSAQFLHSPVQFPRTEVLRAAARAVAPGGMLLVVGHAEPPPWVHHHHPDVDLPSAADVLASLDLDPARWRIERVEQSPRPGVGPDGVEGTLVDSIVAVTLMRE